jgi:peptidoglycan/xylan/chitin deacetylase (PgdA/CDA1 family)
LPLYCGGGRLPLVALTYDDGPSSHTAQLVSVLGRQHAGATFFWEGRRIAQLPSAARSVTAAQAVGDHSWDHPHLTQLSDDDLVSELARTRAAIDANVRQPVGGLFRPPYGDTDARVTAAAAAQGLATILWSTDSNDWATGDADQIASNALAGARPGGIILFHDSDDSWASPLATIEATRIVLAALRIRGLTPVTIGELLALDPPSEAQLRAGPDACGAV